MCLQKRYGVNPDLLCVPPQLLLYMALAPEEKLLYDKGGPTAAATFEAGVEGFKTRQYRGMGVVTSDPVRQFYILNFCVYDERNCLLAYCRVCVQIVHSSKLLTTQRLCRCCTARHRSESFTSWDLLCKKKSRPFKPTVVLFTLEVMMMKMVRSKKDFLCTVAGFL